MAVAIDWPAAAISANVAILFPQLAVLDRPRAAADAGFQAIELWWPFDSATPSKRDLDAVAASVSSAGVKVCSLNFSSGRKDAGERGIPTAARGMERMRSHVPIALTLAELLGCDQMNLLYGNLERGSDLEEQRSRAAEAVAYTAQEAAARGIRTMVEPLGPAEARSYGLRTLAEFHRLVEQVTSRAGIRVGLCFDVYQLCQVEPDLPQAAADSADDIHHVQLADHPGRHEPGTGRLDIPGVLTRLRSAGYGGYIGMEYRPTRPVAGPGRSS